jgi:hypothetical protein
MSDQAQEAAARQFARIVATTLNTHPDIYGAQADGLRVSGSFKDGFNFSITIDLRPDADEHDEQLP